MAKQRYIQDSFWTDPYVEELNTKEKLVFIYLLTNPLCNVAGIYEITNKRISLETDIELLKIKKILNKFVEDGKLIIHKNWILIVHFGKHQSTNPNIEKGVERIIKALPEEIKALKGFERLSYFTLLNLTLLNTVAKATPSNNSITINNETYMCEELTYEPLSEGSKKKSKYGKKTMSVLARKFGELAGIEMRGTFDASSWSKPLGSIYRYFDKDVDKTVKYMEQAIKHFESKNLDYNIHTLDKNKEMMDKWTEESNKINNDLYE